jgi:hypothetical protein
VATVIIVAAVVGLRVHVVAQSTLTLEEKCAMYTISPEVKQCMANRMNELMERVNVAKTDAELEPYRVLLDLDAIKKTSTAKVATDARTQGIVDGLRALDWKPGTQWKPPFPVSQSCAAKIRQLSQKDVTQGAIANTRASTRAGG